MGYCLFCDDAQTVGVVSIHSFLKYIAECNWNCMAVLRCLLSVSTTVFGFVLQCKENALISIKQNDFNRNIVFVLPFNFSSSHHHSCCCVCMCAYTLKNVRVQITLHNCVLWAAYFVCNTHTHTYTPTSAHALSSYHFHTIVVCWWATTDTDKTHTCLMATKLNALK